MGDLNQFGDASSGLGEAAMDQPFQTRRAGRPRSLETNRLSSQVLATARRSFIERGFAHTSIERVALDAGTTRRSVMHRFADRDALLIGVAVEFVPRSLRDVLMETDDGRPPMERLRAVARNLLTLATDGEQVALTRVYMGEAGRLAELSRLLVHYNDELERGIERLVLEVQESGKFFRYSAAAVSTHAIGLMLSNPINRAMLGDPQFRDPHRVDLYFSQMWAIFLLMA